MRGKKAKALRKRASKMGKGVKVQLEERRNGQIQYNVGSAEHWYRELKRGRA